MSYETIMYASIGAGIVLLTVSIIFFIYYRIPDVVNDLTGRKAKRKIEELQSKGRLTSKIRTVSIPGGDESERTGGMGWLKKRKRKKTALLPAANEKISYTGKLEANEIPDSPEYGTVGGFPIQDKDGNTYIAPTTYVKLGGRNSTRPSESSMPGTMPLGDVRPIPGGQNATTLLTPGSMVFPESEKEEFVIKQRIMVIHTNEEIDSL